MTVDLSSRPLLANQRDQALFVGRNWERHEISQDLARGFNVLIQGDRGSGKTSLLRSLMWIAKAEPDNKSRRVYVRAAGLHEPSQILNRVLEVLDGRETPPEQALTAAAALRELADRQEQTPLCILLDDPDPKAGNLLFGVLRDELWETRTQWVVATTTEDATTLLTAPADAYFEVVMRLTPLSGQEAIELLSRRLPEVDHQVIDAIAARGGQPRELVERARNLDAHADPDSISALAAETDRRLGAASRSANMLYAEMRHAGPISASDKGIQERMGWTRPRLIQVLGELEKAGLVEASEQPRNGPGRPKKMYRVLSHFELERNALNQARGGDDG